MTSGVPAERLSDADLRHDLLQLKKKQADIAEDGTSGQRMNHQSRTAELEAEFVKRFGSDEADPRDSADAQHSADSHDPPDSADSPDAAGAAGSDR